MTKRSKKWLGILVSLLVLLTLIAALFIYVMKPSWSLGYVKGQALQYVDSKYGKEFRITNIRYSFGGGFYEVSALSLSDNVRFYIYKENTPSGTEFSDDYLSDAWSKTFLHEITPVIFSEYGKQLGITAGIDITHKSTLGLNDTSIYREYSFNKFRSTFPSHIASELSVYLISNNNKFETGEEEQKLYRLVQYLKGNGFADCAISLYYYDPNKVGPQTLKSDFYQLGDASFESKYETSLNSPSYSCNISDISSMKDVEKVFNH